MEFENFDVDSNQIAKNILIKKVNDLKRKGVL
jgi:hypothetical protein